MSNDLNIRVNFQDPPDATHAGKISLPYGFFTLSIKVLRSSIQLPLNVAISETPDSTVTLGGMTIGGGTAMILNRSAKVADPRNPLHNSYEVDRLTSFEMRWPYISVVPQMKKRQRDVADFKGSTLNVTVSNSSGFSETARIRIDYGNPNNHYHWDSEPSFVDGWFFKTVHTDSATGKATPFFFLYGVNNPAGGAHAESFVICGNAGSIQMQAGLEAALAGAVPSQWEMEKLSFTHGQFYGEKEHRLYSTIDSVFKAMDTGCTGNKTLASGQTISWDLKFTKVHSQIQTDYNPLLPFKAVTPGWLTMPGCPLFVWVKKIPGIPAYWMGQSMNCLVTGTVNWKGTTYQFDKHKGYQDENWGAAGFPHPYVWFQANNFRDGSTLLHDTSLVGMYTPGMESSLAPSKVIVSGIQFKYAGKTYQFFTADAQWLPDVILSDVFFDIGTVSCNVEFMQAGVRKTVDLSDIDQVNAKLGAFPRSAANRAVPVKWTLEARNDAGLLPGSGDHIKIIFECDQSSVYGLPAPMAGSIQPDATKQTSQARVTVVLTPKGGVAKTLYSDFATIDYGD